MASTLGKCPLTDVAVGHTNNEQKRHVFVMTVQGDGSSNVTVGSR